MSSIQTIIFDFGGVLLNLKTEQEWLKEDLLPNFHPEKLQQLQEKGLFKEIETGKISNDMFIQSLRDIALDTNISDEAICQLWNGILLKIHPQRIEILQQLHKNYNLILLSNTNAIHAQKFITDMLHDFGENILQTYFHTVYYSHEIGMRKPDKEIYEFVMEQQQLNPENILFLDDKPENLEIPKALGWQTQQVNFNKLSIVDVQHLIN